MLGAGPYSMYSRPARLKTALYRDIRFINPDALIAMVKPGQGSQAISDDRMVLLIRNTLRGAFCPFMNKEARNGARGFLAPHRVKLFGGGRGTFVVRGLLLWEVQIPLPSSGQPIPGRPLGGNGGVAYAGVKVAVHAHGAGCWNSGRFAGLRLSISVRRRSRALVLSASG
jgi:hypothetical protein